MKKLNTSLIALALIATGATSALALDGPHSTVSSMVYSDTYARTNTSNVPSWTREGSDRSNYRLDRESRDTLRLDDSGIAANQH
jgi:hypothetical protein